MSYNNAYSRKTPHFGGRDEIPNARGSFNQENYNFDPNLQSSFGGGNLHATNQSAMRFDMGLS